MCATFSGRATAWFALALALLMVAYVVAIDEVAGLYLDDGWYLVLAKALASGHGFTLINAPIADVLPFYPPGFPALLSIVFRIAPEFPANVWLLKSVSVAAVGLAAVLARHYFVQVRGTTTLVASALALLIVAQPNMHFLVTSTVMSEAVFTALQMAAIVAVEHAVQRADGRVGDRGGYVRVVLAGVLVSATMLVRSIGVVFVPSAVLYVLLRAGWRRALMLAATALVLLGSWQTYAALAAPTVQQRAIVNDPIAWPYTDQFLMRYAGRAESGRVTLAELPARISDNLRRLAMESVGAVDANPLVERVTGKTRGAWSVGSACSLVMALLTLLGWGAVLRSGATVVELYVAGTIALLLVFAFPADRYLLPLLPFLGGYLAMGAAVVRGALLRAFGRPSDVARAGDGSLAAIVVGTLLLINVAGTLADCSDTLGLTPGRRTAWRRAYAENLSLMSWVHARFPRDVVLATHNPGMVYLFTGNPTVGSWEAETNAANWRAAKARFWVDNTVAEYRFPNFERSGLPALLRTDHLRLGVYQIPPAGAVVR